MLTTLAAVELELPTLLKEIDGWQSLDIDYHPPFVERVWRQWGEFRIALHRIHPCSSAEALFHPHPWPSAMRILSGTYEMAVGYGAGDTPPPIAARFVASGADMDVRYEMTDPDAWHYVRPIGEPTYSVMLTGRPWARIAPQSEHPLKPLAPSRVHELLEWFAARYDLPPS
jgi:hypothetical protein